VGDLIMTDKPASAPATIYVESIPKFLANVGRHRGHRAVRVKCRYQER
jgi:flagellar motor switch protein FliM